MLDKSEASDSIKPDLLVKTAGLMDEHLGSMDEGFREVDSLIGEARRTARSKKGRASGGTSAPSL